MTLTKNYAFVFLLIYFTSCAQNKNSTSVIRTPEPLNDGLAVASLQQSGIDSLLLLKVLSKIDNKEYQGVNSILIIKDGNLVFEQYFPGYDFKYEATDQKGDYIEYDCNAVHNLASVTKSITGLLCGIAIDKGLIKSTDDKLFNYFPKDSALFDSGKKEISLFHLLTMSSGLKWNEHDMSYTNLQNDIVQLFITPDPEKYILSKSLGSKPGTQFYYNGGGTNLVGRIIQKTSSDRLDLFAQKNLFNPLGIKNPKWVFVKPQFVYASGDLRITPRDMSKIGMLVLNKGKWDNQQIVSSNWIEQMIKESVHFPDGTGYGFQWWLRDYSVGSMKLRCISAGGWGGQSILVFPDINVIIVFTGENYNSKSPNEEILNRYLLPAIQPGYDYDYESIKSAAPLPDDLIITSPAYEKLQFLSGCWYGKWGYYLPTQLAIEKVEKDSVTVIYAWPDEPYGYFKKGWLRHTAAVDQSGKFEFNVNNTYWKYEYDKNENVLIGYYKEGNINEKVIMKKRTNLQ